MNSNRQALINHYAELAIEVNKKYRQYLESRHGIEGCSFLKVAMVFSIMVIAINLTATILFTTFGLTGSMVVLPIVSGTVIGLAISYEAFINDYFKLIQNRKEINRILQGKDIIDLALIKECLQLIPLVTFIVHERMQLRCSNCDKSNMQALGVKLRDLHSWKEKKGIRITIEKGDYGYMLAILRTCSEKGEEIQRKINQEALARSGIDLI